MRLVKCPIVNGRKIWWHATDEHPYTIIKYNSRPKVNQTHIRILNYIAECQFSKTNSHLPNRTEILMHIKNWSKSLAKVRRGQYSHIFSNLLYKDFIRYDKDFKYSITNEGLSRLAVAKLNK